MEEAREHIEEERVHIPPIPEGTAVSPLLAFLALLGVNPDKPTEVRDDTNNRGSRS
jgi:hypothetical protein